jgi:hypothetical protein
MARRVLGDTDRTLRNRFKLRNWVSKPEDRRRTYFEWCDDVLARLKKFTGGEEPSDESVVITLMGVLREDDSFSGHVDSKGGGEFLTSDENWTKVYHAAGATIYHEYLVAVEKKEWPLSDG